MFTNGSKTEEGVAAVAVSTKRINKPFTCQLPNDSSIYTAELFIIPKENRFWYYLILFHCYSQY